MIKEDREFKYGCIVGLIALILYIALFPFKNFDFISILLWSIGIVFLPMILSFFFGFGMIIGKIHNFFSSLSINKNSQESQQNSSITKFKTEHKTTEVKTVDDSNILLQKPLTFNKNNNNLIIGKFTENHLTQVDFSYEIKKCSYPSCERTTDLFKCEISSCKNYICSEHKELCVGYCYDDFCCMDD